MVFGIPTNKSRTSTSSEKIESLGYAILEVGRNNYGLHLEFT
jgi:hypothetical protein